MLQVTVLVTSHILYPSEAVAAKVLVIPARIEAVLGATDIAVMVAMCPLTVSVAVSDLPL
jgi:hypothetical protein